VSPSDLHLTQVAVRTLIQVDDWPAASMESWPCYCFDFIMLAKLVIMAKTWQDRAIILTLWADGEVKLYHAVFLYYQTNLPQ
jgi:hypothetical protein